MSKVTVCDVCGERLDILAVEEEDQHIRAELIYHHLGTTDSRIERDFCQPCWEEKLAHFEARPFVDGLAKKHFAAT